MFSKEFLLWLTFKPDAILSLKDKWFSDKSLTFQLGVSPFIINVISTDSLLSIGPISSLKTFNYSFVTRGFVF